MSLNSGERQVYPAIGRVRPDHTARYYWANTFMKHGDNVLDAMCGVGYGSFTIAIGGRVNVQSFDIDQETIEYANKWYKLPNISYRCHRYQDMQYPEASFDKIVCFEGIEHVIEPVDLLHRLRTLIKDSGILLISTPNGAKLQRDPVKHPEHFFHYLPEELGRDLELTGFKPLRWLSQHNKHSVKMNNDLEGIFMLVVAEAV